MIIGRCVLLKTKRIIILISLFLISCIITIYLKKNNFYGVYKVKNIVFSSSLISVSKDYYEEQIKNTKYIFKKDLFKIESVKGTFEIEKPLYKRSKVDQKIITQLNDIPNSTSKYKDKYIYSLYDSNNNRLNYKFILLDNEILLISYYDINKNIIMNILELKQ